VKNFAASKGVDKTTLKEQQIETQERDFSLISNMSSSTAKTLNPTAVELTNSSLWDFLAPP